MPQGPTEAISSRFFPHPPARLFDAFRDPAQLARWWGPKGFTAEFHEFDPRPGGRWRFDLIAPDGTRHPQDKTFVEVDPPRRIVLRHAQKGHDFTMTMTHAEEAGGTRLTWSMRFASPDEFAAVERHVVQGNEENFDRLAAHLAARAQQGDDTMSIDTGFTIERTFKAAPERVWAMWTTPEGIAKWWVPSMRDMGFDMRVRHMDVRVGGKFAFEMTSKEHNLVNGGTYVVVDPHRELAWTWHFDIFLAPGQPPYDVPISVRLERTPAGGTRMTFRQGPLATGGHTEGSRQGVLKNLDRMAQALGEPEPQPALVVERVVKAPPERVFRAWTEPDVLKRWWAPEGCSTPHVSVDLRVGGLFHYCIRLPDGKDVWGRGVYQEIAAPSRLAYLDSFSDEKASIIPPAQYGADPRFPAEALVRVTFDAVNGGTRVTLRHEMPLDLKDRAATEKGWTEMCARLAATLEA